MKIIHWVLETIVFDFLIWALAFRLTARRSQRVIDWLETTFYVPEYH
jgi:hypothetical protein